MDPDYSRDGDAPPPPRDVPLVVSNQATVTRVTDHTTDTRWFSPDAMVEMPYGYGEGYFRHLVDTQETVKWNEGAEVFDQGRWNVPEHISFLPWPLQRSVDAGYAPYTHEFVERLRDIEQILFENGSVIPSNVIQECCLCQHYIKERYARHYVLSLDAFDQETQVRWPSIYLHYVTDHRVLPSVMFARIVLERKVDDPEDALVSLHENLDAFE